MFQKVNNFSKLALSNVRFLKSLGLIKNFIKKNFLRSSKATFFNASRHFQRPITLINILTPKLVQTLCFEFDVQGFIF